MMKIAAGLLLFTVSLFGQVVPGRYILELSGAPAVTSTASVRALGLESRRAAVRQRQLDIRRQVPQHGGQVIESLDTVYNGLIVTVPEARAAELSQIPGVVAVHKVYRVRPVLDHALPLHKVPDAWATLPLGQNSAGAGVKIAMIDSGIDVNHPAFATALPPVSGFPKVLADVDTAYTNSKIIVAKNYTTLLGVGGEPTADDTDGHGSGTSMAAAGGPVVSPYASMSGVAPMAYLGNYKVLASGSSTTDLIAKAIDDAVADGMDVINISLGSFVTSFADIAPDEPSIASIEAASKAGVIVVVSAGNSGPGATTIGNFASAPSAVSVGAMLNDRVLFYSVAVSGVPPYEAFPGNGPDPGQAISGTLFDVTKLDPTGLACSPLPAGSATGMVVLVLRGNCFFDEKINNAAAGGAAAVIVYNSPTGTPNTLMDVGSATLPAMFVNNPEGLDLKSRVAANSGLQVTLDFLGITPFAVTPGLSDFSSRGPSLGTTLKPDMVAVGEGIVTAAQKTYPDGESYDPSGYIDTAGTSFSSPLVAGAVAVLKSAHPGLTVQQYRSLLINHPGTIANLDGTPTTVSQAGSGMLNLAAAINGTVAANPTSISFGTGTGTINATVNLSLANVGAASDTFKITAKPAAGSPAPTVATDTVRLDPNGSQQVPVTLNASGLTAGEYQGYLQVTGTGGSTATIPYWFAVPGTAPAAISIVYSDFFDFSRSTAPGAIVFRIVDVAGLPLGNSDTPKVTVSAGGGTVRSVYKAGDIPGTYGVDLRTGTSNMQIDITVGSVTQSVVIPIF
jgi:minor extracellular serine protease Vpr